MLNKTVSINRSAPDYSHKTFPFIKLITHMVKLIPIIHPPLSFHDHQYDPNHPLLFSVKHS